jgi:HTH-type transcriptional regulator/antitoxin HigA
MNEVKTNTYTPDYAIHPGEILEETLEARGIKKIDLANRCGLAQKTVSQIIHGKATISPSIAIKLERAIGVSASLWNNLAKDYDLYIAREEDNKKLELEKQWVKQFPLKELIERGILKKKISLAESLSDLLKFFGVSNIHVWEKLYLEQNVAYRKSSAYENKPKPIATWLRIGELLSEKIDCAPYNKNKFKSALNEIRNMTTLPIDEFIKGMTKKCNEAGISLVFIPELPKTHVSGATKWLQSDKAMIILSLRYKVDDHFWFSFFHEAAHILLHGKLIFLLKIQKKKRKTRKK